MQNIHWLSIENPFGIQYSEFWLCKEALDSSCRRNDSAGKNFLWINRAVQTKANKISQKPKKTVTTVKTNRTQKGDRHDQQTDTETEKAYFAPGSFTTEEAGCIYNDRQRTERFQHAAAPHLFFGLYDPTSSFSTEIMRNPFNALLKSTIWMGDSWTTKTGRSCSRPTYWSTARRLTTI